MLVYVIATPEHVVAFPDLQEVLVKEVHARRIVMVEGPVSPFMTSLCSKDGTMMKPLYLEMGLDLIIPIGIKILCQYVLVILDFLVLIAR